MSSLTVETKSGLCGTGIPTRGGELTGTAREHATREGIRDMNRQELTQLVDAKRCNDPWGRFGWSFYSRDKKYLWVLVAKVACVTTTVTLRRLEGKPHSSDPLWGESGLSKLKEARTSEIIEILTSDEWFKFAFVRNPYDRLFSAYKSKIGNVNAEEFYREIQDTIRRRCDYPIRDGKPAGVVSFRDFVRYVQSGLRSGDNHWCVQVDNLMMDMISYDFIGRFERFGEDFRTVLHRLDAPAEVLETASHVRGETTRVRLAAAFDREIADTVYEIYKQDFETFGYDRDSWMFDDLNA
jgi:hypothetical protein